MDQIISSCNASADYPKNLIQSSTYEFVSNSYFEKLNEREEYLFATDDRFTTEDKAALEFWELGATGRSTSRKRYNED